MRTLIPSAETFTEAVQEQQAACYRAFFELFREHNDAISSVSFWGVADDNTWLSEFSSGRQDFPLLFDVNHQEGVLRRPHLLSALQRSLWIGGLQVLLLGFLASVLKA